MSPRVKKLLGLAALLPYVGVYLTIAAAIGERVPPVLPLQVGYFFLAGVAWAFPLKPVLTWMNAAPKGAPAPPPPDKLP